MSEKAPHDRKRLHFGLLLLISFALFNLGYLVDQTVRWSDPFQGFVNGVFHIFVFGIAWGIYIVPWSLLVFGLYRWRGWKRFRTHWVLGPAVLMFFGMIGELVIDPPTASNRFERFAKTELPENARNLQYHFSGGGLADYSDTYYFETTSEEVDRLIAEMNLSEDESYPEGEFSHAQISRLEHGPDFLKWEGARKYGGWDERGHWFFNLITDATRTKVYMMVGCI